MLENSIDSVFTQEIHNKYLVFNTLFSRLPYDKMTKIGQLMPFLHDMSEADFEAGKEPKEIIDTFFKQYTSIKEEKEKIDLLFRFITYIERQVVLFDSVEDSAFEKLNPLNGKGTLQGTLDLALQQDKLAEVHEKLKNFKVRIVFTAHPTQFYPSSVLRIIQDLEQLIPKNDINGIDSLLQQLGKTPFINEQKPTPLEEAQSIIFYLRHVYYQVIGEIHDKLRSYFQNGSGGFNPVLELGFWPGGDRDGNPFVTAEISKKVSIELRTSILKCYYNDFKIICRRLTFKGVMPLLTAISNRIYTNMNGLKHDLTLHELLSSLDEVRQLLITKHKGIFLNLLDRFIQQVKLFGLHFASLDIRQDSSIHENVMEQINQKYGISDKPYDKWSDVDKLRFLTEHELTIKEEDFEETLTKDTFRTVRIIKEIQELNGEKACHRYIISNSTSTFSVLEVLALFRFCGYKAAEIKVDIVPLFETIEGLDNSQSTMTSLYQLPFYKNHLENRANHQTIMLGFSDGTKDGGYVKANWEIYQAKEKLTRISKKNQIEVIFFDGRGGPPARGGGKTHQFYASQGPTIANNEIQITIQGQTITSMYGSRSQAMYNFEQLLSAGIINDVFQDDKSIINKQERNLIEELAEEGVNKYFELKEHPLFVPYLENKSPLKYYGLTNIGSRPSKRSSGKKLTLSDLRAIPFVGSWSQLKQNVPGYFGFGTALQKVIDEGRLEDLKLLYENSLYFKTLIENSMMGLTKTYFPLTYYMKKDPEYGEFWQILFDEYKLTVKNMLLVTGQESLMANEKLSKLSIDYREHIVLPLLTIQQYALQKIEETTDEKLRLVYEKMVTRSLFGNINASRNSA
ncbi:phosphoenolpyruvate carboxylase [Emticicia sp. BO119]|uniref:phosphoenolpyruvate carboxylase n=1 Tax=Emticicia sp. BO119 TaxID=2757768 RepID=UPI0015F0F9BA|nr:phosphoenolpyruvate carboxylase [Emticicia sp. BO119]MBA4850230.1 phosphoenolpyruvate carboxylase [Emticicia sp. BO119]